jgi:hypothetical protein
MPRPTPASNACTPSELLLLVSLLVLWLGITVLLGAWSLLIWAGAVAMAMILRPSHQRQRTPESVTDVLSVAVTWCVALGAAGLACDLFVPVSRAMSDVSWTFLAELAGFYLGFVWVLVLLLIRHLEQLSGRFDRPRPLA